MILLLLSWSSSSLVPFGFIKKTLEICTYYIKVQESSRLSNGLTERCQRAKYWLVIIWILKDNSYHAYSSLKTQMYERESDPKKVKSNHKIREQNVTKALWLQLDSWIYILLKTHLQLTTLNSKENVTLMTLWHNNTFLVKRGESV